MPDPGWLHPRKAKSFHFFENGEGLSLCQLWEFRETNGIPRTEDQVEGTPLCQRCTKVLAGESTLRTKKKLIPVGKIIPVVCQYFNLQHKELISGHHYEERVKARQMAMLLLRDHTELSFPAIGRFLGDRHHATVMHGIKKITAQMKYSQDLRVDLDCLEERLCA